MLTQTQSSPSACALAAGQGWLWLEGDEWLLGQEIACSLKPRAFPCRCQVGSTVIKHLDSDSLGVPSRFHKNKAHHIGSSAES